MDYRFFPLADRCLKSWRPNRSVPVNTSAASTGESLKEDRQPVGFEYI